MAATTSSTGRARRWRTTAAAVAVATVPTLAPGGLGGPAVPAGAQTASSEDQAWVATVYADLLDRPPTPAQAEHRRAQLAAGTPRRAIADELVASREHVTLLVQRMYRRILGRAADASSAAYWRERLVGGERDSTVASFLYGSPELYQRAGATAEGYVTFLYRDVLGREPDAAGLAYWTQRVQAGENRTGLARSWYLTPEAAGLRAGLVFLDLLDRPPSATERPDWAGRLRRFDLRRIEAALVTSGEYGRNATEPGHPTRLTGGDAASTAPSISADGRIVAFASAASDLTPAGSPPGTDIFVLDRQTGRLRAITAGNGASTDPEVSADGSTVVFQSAATDLLPGDGNGKVDVFRAPTAGGAIEQLTEGNGDSTDPTVSGDGTVVALTTAATDLVAGDTDDATDVLVRTDGTGGAPATWARIAGTGAASQPALSADGGTIVLVASGLVEGEGAGAYLTRLPLAPEPTYVRISTAFAASGPTVSADGSRTTVVEYEPVGGSYMSRVLYSRIEGDEVTLQHGLDAGYKPQWARIADGGGHALALALFFDEGIGVKLLALEGPSPIPRLLPEAPSDLTADGHVVVAPSGRQLVLYEAP